MGVHVSDPSHVDRFRKDSRWVRSTIRVALDTTNEMINRFGIGSACSQDDRSRGGAARVPSVIEVVSFNQTIVSGGLLPSVRRNQPVSSYDSVVQNSQTLFQLPSPSRDYVPASRRIGWVECDLARRRHMPFDNPFEVPFDDMHLLMNARARIASPHCWLQGRFRNGDRYCLVAALSVECDSRSIRFPNRTERRLARRLAKQLPMVWRLWPRWMFLTPRYRLTMFNDDCRTRHKNVVALFDRTIEQLMTEAPLRVAP
jgi:hypothetical protein